jgi:hypothetical protein
MCGGEPADRLDRTGQGDEIGTITLTTRGGSPTF